MPTEPVDPGRFDLPSRRVHRAFELARLGRAQRGARAVALRRFGRRPEVERMLAAHPDRRVIWSGGWPRVATVVDDIVPARLGRETFDLVRGLLEGAGTDYFLTNDANDHRFQLGIDEKHWDAFVDSLAAVAAERALYVGIGATTRRNSVIPFAVEALRPGVLEAARHQGVIDVFAFYQDRTSGTVYGHQYRCQVERWTRNEHDMYTSAVRNPTTQMVSPSLLTTVAGPPGRTEERRLAAAVTPTVFDVDYPIDAVYMWVDGNDPDWRRRFAEAKAATGDATSGESVAIWRFRDRDELRHSLRSLEMYAPWIRHIHLVTDRQVPEWLDTSHPKISVVDHREIFGDDATLPTFNSHAIGSRLHHIPGLADHYLVLNDDVFFASPIRPEVFFEGNGALRFFLSKSRAPIIEPEAMTAIESARRNAATLLERDFGKRISAIFLHAPVAQNRQIMLELEERYPQAFEADRHSQFRSHTDVEVNSWLHHYYAYLTGRAVPGSLRYGYFDINQAKLRRQMSRAGKVGKLQVFCVNDGPPENPDDEDFGPWFAQWMAEKFPRRSSFER